MYGRHVGAVALDSVAEDVPLEDNNNTTDCLSNDHDDDDYVDDDLDDLEDEEEYLDDDICDEDFVVDEHATGSVVPPPPGTATPVRPVTRSVRAAITKAAAAPPQPAGGDKRKADDSLERVTPPKKTSKEVATKKPTSSTAAQDQHNAHLRGLLRETCERIKLLDSENLKLREMAGTSTTPDNVMMMQEFEALRASNAGLATTLAEMQATNATLVAQLAELQTSNTQLVGQLTMLNSRMAQKDEEIATLKRLAESDRELARTQALERAEREQDLTAAARKAAVEEATRIKGKKGKPVAQLLCNVDQNTVVPTSNKYAALAADVDAIDVDEEADEEADQADEPQPGTSGVKPLPKKKATVGDKLPNPAVPQNLYFKFSIKELEDKLIAIPGVKGNYYARGISKSSSTARGMSEEVNALITAAMDADRPDYHVNPKRSEAKVKVALYNLGGYEPDEVMAMLLECPSLPVKPLEVVVMRRYDHATRERTGTSNFTVTFPAGTRLSELKKVDRLDHRTIKFDRLAKSSRTPYCVHCQTDGHVKDGCHHEVMCGRCGERHDTNTCPKFDRAVPGHLLFCYRCVKTGHPAFYNKCPHRARYFEGIERQRKARAAKQTGPTPARTPARTTPISAAKAKALAHKAKWTTPSPVGVMRPAGAWAAGSPMTPTPTPTPAVDVQAIMGLVSQQIATAMGAMAQEFTKALREVVSVQRQSNGGD